MGKRMRRVRLAVCLSKAGSGSVVKVAPCHALHCAACACRSILHLLPSDKASTERPTQVTELRLECKKLQDQVNQLYEEKSKLAEKLLAESEQLRIVRDNFNQQDKTVTEQNKSIKEVKAQKKEMQAQIDLLKAAQVATAEEIKVRNNTERAAASASNQKASLITASCQAGQGLSERVLWIVTSTYTLQWNRCSWMRIGLSSLSKRTRFDEALIDISTSGCLNQNCLNLMQCLTRRNMMRDSWTPRKMHERYVSIWNALDDAFMFEQTTLSALLS